MKYYVFLLSLKDSKDGGKQGFGYAIAHKSDWIECPDLPDVHTNYVSSYSAGRNYLVHNGKAYKLYKDYLDIDEHYYLLVCVESEYGCDTKEFS